MELVMQLEDLLHKWMKGCAGVEDVLERIIVEQLLSTMPEDLCQSESLPLDLTKESWLMTICRPDTSKKWGE